MMWLQFGLACCEIELIQVSMPRYDIEHFGAAPKLNVEKTFGTGTKIKKTLTALRGRWPRPLLEKLHPHQLRLARGYRSEIRAFGDALS
jgi:hypothetical protein